MQPWLRRRRWLRMPRAVMDDGVVGRDAGGGWHEEGQALPWRRGCGRRTVTRGGSAPVRTAVTALPATGTNTHSDTGDQHPEIDTVPICLQCIHAIDVAR